MSYGTKYRKRTIEYREDGDAISEINHEMVENQVPIIDGHSQFLGRPSRTMCKPPIGVEWKHQLEV